MGEGLRGNLEQYINQPEHEGTEQEKLDQYSADAQKIIHESKKWQTVKTQQKESLWREGRYPREMDLYPMGELSEGDIRRKYLELYPDLNDPEHPTPIDRIGEITDPEDTLVPIKSIIPDCNITDELGLSRLRQIVKDKRLNEEGSDQRTPSYTTRYGVVHAMSYTGSMHDLIEKGDPEEKEMLRRIFTDKVIVDLGAGAFGHGYSVAQRLGAKAYIGVEPFYFDLLCHNISDDNGKQQIIRNEVEDKPKIIPAAISTLDMLTFLKRLPDQSVCIMSSGVEELVQFTRTKQGEKYKDAVMKEIERVMVPGGGYLSGEQGLNPNENDNKLEQTQLHSSDENRLAGYLYTNNQAPS